MFKLYRRGREKSNLLARLTEGPGDDPRPDQGAVMIVKLKDDAYVVWSGVTDSPTSSVMTKAEMIEEVKDQQLRQMHLRPGELEAIEDPRLRDLKKQVFDVEVNMRLERVEKNGTSSLHGATLEDLLSFNRAGKGETHVKTVEELIEIYTYTPDKKGQWPWT